MYVHGRPGSSHHKIADGIRMHATHYYTTRIPNCLGGQKTTNKNTKTVNKMILGGLPPSKNPQRIERQLRKQNLLGG